jgi:hypothetical protein
MTTERTIIAILVAFILGVLFTATPVGGTVLDPIRGVLRPAASPGPDPVNLMNFQGELTDPGTGDPVADGSYSIRFSIWTLDVGGTEQWNETQNVQVTGGLFNVLLGSVTPVTAGVFAESPRYLEVKVGTDPAMTPRQQFVTAPYAFHAVNAWALDGNSGTTAGTDVLGTADNEPLELHVNGARALRLEPDPASPNLIGGFSGNSVTGGVVGATIGGGGGSGVETNRVTDNYGTVGGGKHNLAGDDTGTTSDSTDATVGGGDTNTASGNYATVAGGMSNTASGDSASVGGGANNTASDLRATVGGGQGNTASFDATVGGGWSNTASGSFATVGGGLNNIANSTRATVGGGAFGSASGIGATVGGGQINTASDMRATVGGGGSNTASGQEATIGGGWSNSATAIQATVGGGLSNTASGQYGTVGGGANNSATAIQATVGGGQFNSATQAGTVGGGYSNSTGGVGSTVGGGLINSASGSQATVAGGSTNSASGGTATVGGGWSNSASGNTATVAGGAQNTAAGDYSFAAGRRAKIAAAHDGALLFADQNDFDFNSAAANEFAVRSVGGARVVTAIDGSGNPTAGVKLDPGDTAWEVLSDRDSKENYVLVDPRAVLERLSGVSISEWNYKAQDNSIRHIGPTAQDFYAAFGLSDDDGRYISPIDTDGVALAAIQGLYELVQERDARVDALESRLGITGGASDVDIAPQANSADISAVAADSVGGSLYGLLLALPLALPVMVVAGVLGRRALARARS